jgi:hypothetical protein
VTLASKYETGLPWNCGEYIKWRSNKEAYEMARSKQKGGVDKLAYNICRQIVRIEKRKASLIIIDGMLGEGKTTLALHLADYIEGREVPLEEYIAMGGKEFTRMLPEAFQRRQKVLIYDEAGDYDSKGALTAFNRMLNQVFNTFRVFRLVVILVLPSFLALDKSLWFKGIPRLLIHVRPRRNLGFFDVYNADRAQWIKAKAEGNAPNMKKLVKIHDSYKLTTPNFSGVFYNVSPERSHQLDMYGIKGKTAIYAQAAIVGQGLVSYYDIAHALDRSEIWVKKAIIKLKIKHLIKKSRRKYFDKSVIGVLREEKSSE